MMQKKFVFLESNTTGTGEYLILKAKNKGFIPILCIENKEKYKFLPLKDIKIVIIDTKNKKLLLEYLSKEGNISGIYSSSDYFIEMASQLAMSLGLRGTNPDSITVCRNKYKLYQSLKETEIKVPETKKILNIDRFKSEIVNYFFPVIIKPVSNSGSMGVKLCQNQQQALEHMDYLIKNYSQALVQEYIEGIEFSVEVFSFNSNHHIIGITQKYLGDLPNFVEVGHDFPAVLKKELEEKIHSIVKKLLTHLNFNFGFSHIELRIKNGEIIIIEVNPRLAGGMIPVLVNKATGLDLLDTLLDIYSEQSSVFPLVSYMKFASIRHLLPLCSGIIKNIGFNSSILVDEIKWMKKKGDCIKLHGDFSDRLAYTIVSDLSAEGCRTKAEKALENFNLEIENKS